MNASPDSPARPLTARAGGALSGTITVPGDKSISHRALMLSALAVGETRITGLLEGDDVRATAGALRAMGVEIARTAPGVWQVYGVGVGGLSTPDDVIDLGNSGTSARLLCGLIAGHDMCAVLTGDASLRRRPMGRVTVPLAEMGARFTSRPGGLMPLTVTGTDELLPIDYTLPVPSAQVKSAVLLAGLHAPGETSVIEPEATRDHTERMLRGLGADIRIADLPGGGRRVTVVGQPDLTPADIDVPADPSSAAFPLVAALLVPGSEVILTGISTNPTRTGLFETLLEMGADLVQTSAREAGGEPVADLRVRAGTLRGVTVPAGRAPSMIDEYPVLAMAAACAEGTTVFEGVGELRVKESDRLAGVARGLSACGVRVEEETDRLTIHGEGQPPRGGATIAAELDHRIAMSFLVLGLATRDPVTVDDARPIDTSFPGFPGLMRSLGADFSADGPA